MKGYDQRFHVFELRASVKYHIVIEFFNCFNLFLFYSEPAVVAAPMRRKKYDIKV